MANVRFVQNILYKMKMNYGAPMRYGRITKNSIDFDTGQNTVVKQMWEIPQVIVLSTILQRKFAQDIAYLAANKNFTYGAMFDENTSLVIVDKRDVPPDLELTMDDFIWHNHKRYMLKKIELLEHDCGWLLTMLNHEGANPFDMIPAVVRHSLQLQQEISYVLEQ